MRLELTGRHLEITPALRRLVDARLRKLERLLNDSAVSAQVVLTQEKNRLQVDITLHARGEKFLHGVGSSAAWATSLSEATDKISQQARKVKGKWQERKRHGLQRTPAVETVRERDATPARREPVRRPKIYRSARLAVPRLSVPDAVRALDARGEDLVIFRDPERASISVLYRRRSGELTLVETDA